MKMDRIRETLGVSGSFFSAMKRRMGLANVRFGFLSSFADFIQQNPTFKQADVYHRPACKCGECQERRSRPPGPRRGRPRRSADVNQSNASAQTSKSAGLSLT